jgi:hypothetical protein
MRQTVAPRRRWFRGELQGYLVWGTIALVIVVPEVWTVITPRTPYVPLTDTLSHLSGPWKFIIAFLLLSFHDPDSPPAGPGDKSNVPHSRVGGLYYFPVVLGITLATCLSVVETTDDKWIVAYTIYGTLALVTVVLPTLLAFGFGRDVSYPTFTRTVADLDQRNSLAGRAVVNVARILKLY